MKSSRQNKIRFYFLLFAFISVAGFPMYKHSLIRPVCSSLSEKNEVLRVAHAGGGINGATYTNSIEALNVNYSKGFRYFEIDFNTTSDGNIVCVHDWPEFNRLGGSDAKRPLSLADFEAINESFIKYKKCTLNSLAQWLGEHDDAFLITDVKDNNLEALKSIINLVPNSKAVVIPQIYSPGEYDWLAEVGIEKVIWTLYRSRLTNAEVLKELDGMDRVIAVTMPIARTESFFPVRVLSKGTAVYAHTVNNSDEYLKLTQKFCVSEVYTDFLTPNSHR